ncbi:YqgE/AlgH family protein [Aeromicrobium phragmitis]|uniref:UPF0301 protein D9V41_06375 n=1 Tax=Aeromicrobium phragmitis TaxID=2478914 RepID=A0A3L8PMV3_9ACTN|nr:YqgE/AlgH family protein [Aeromicrobium phragmitis]RLV56685.1 YqgE/AlgH family protein [Aeromicrobium phragmitis]
MSTVDVRGRLLVAAPAIEGGLFYRSVVYMLDHDAEGAVGVIVNRPLDSGVDEVLPEWGDAVNAPGCLFNGGPVSTDAALAVGVIGAASLVPSGWRPTYGRVGLVDLTGPVPPHGTLQGLRIFAGYAGWDAGQLEEELDEGSWVVVDAEEGDLLSATPELLWSSVLRRQDDDLRLLSTYPEDPTFN